MVKHIIILWVLLVILLIPSEAAVEQGFYELADSVLKGGTKYTLEEIQDVSELTEIPLHHRTIVEVSMLGSIEDESRYLTAIAKATDYIESGTVDWAKDFLRMQRGFAYGLLGEREKGAKDLETILDAERLVFLNSVNDPILDIMRKRSRDLAVELDSLMRQTVGNYYMDHREKGSLPIEALGYFSSIKSKPLRDKCLLELKSRLGNDEYEKLVESSKNVRHNIHSKKKLSNEAKSNSNGESQEDRELPRSTDLLRKEQNVEIVVTKTVPSNPFWYLGIGLILGFFLAILLVRIRQSK